VKVLKVENIVDSGLISSPTPFVNLRYHNTDKKTASKKYKKNLNFNETKKFNVKAKQNSLKVKVMSSGLVSNS